ncbi:DUF3560 domain-containing protein [Stenotrophomonas maltophilia]|uniref:DUF3560 domain-containing protein n=1 Tax=Stenotrophomonas maltophilia TaxID=40324 RepID=UPI001FA6EDAF|nr:DUF3560 domain-containing protein [Stenotrophomonas maltophilia]
MTLQHIQDSNSHSEEPALEARPADVVEAESYRSDLTATYSPDDNKLRLYAACRLDQETKDRVIAAGFKWAPKQGLFVAPMWTPGREDLLLSLCGEITDEDTSLTERQEDRADRFNEYSANRQKNADTAHRAVDAICERIPLGQPILVGHHSERAARRDQARIHNGMRKAVNCWKQSEYWAQRAAASLAHAKYKERPDVRARRIKKIEADKRRAEREIAESTQLCGMWERGNLTAEQALKLTGMHSLWFTVEVDGAKVQRSTWSLLESGQWTADQVAQRSTASYAANIARLTRWIAHYSLRLDYERAMLGEAGGLPADRFDIQAGGSVLVRGAWHTVVRVNKRGGRIVSVRTDAQFVPVRPIEEVRDYQAPAEGAGEQAKGAKLFLGPIINVPGAGVVEMTAAEFKATHRDYKGVQRVEATPTSAAYRYRSVVRQGALVQVYLTDAKTVTLPVK